MAPAAQRRTLPGSVSDDRHGRPMRTRQQSRPWSGRRSPLVISVLVPSAVVAGARSHAAAGAGRMTRRNPSSPGIGGVWRRSTKALT